MTEAAAKVESDIQPEEELATATGDNASETVTLTTGVVVTVHKCKLKDSAAVARAVNTVLIALSVNSMEGATQIDVNNPTVLLGALDLASDSIIEAMAALTDQTPEALGELELDDALAVLFKVVEVNKRFFLNRVQVVLSGFLDAVESNQK